MEKPKITKRDILITTGKELFMKHGFRRVSVEDICAKAGTSKMTFYRFFPNKTELAKTIFVTIAEDGYVKFKSILSSDSSPEEKIHKLLVMKMEGTDQVSQEFIVDFYTSKETGLKEFVTTTIEDYWRGVITDFRKAQQDGIFRDDFNPEFFFLISQKITTSLDDPAMIRLFPNPQAMVMELINIMMYGIVPRK
jgi:AcrR family transcriptional regulator